MMSNNKPLTPGYSSPEGENHFHNEEGDLMIDFSGGETKNERQSYYKKQANEVVKDGDIDLSNGWPKHLVWETKDKRKIPIPEMADSHLLNTIAFLRRRVEPVYKKRMIAQLVKGLVKTSFIKQMFDLNPWEEDAADYKLNQLKGHLKEIGQRIYNKTDDEFLREFNPQFPHLLQEAYRRKLLIEVDSSKIAHNTNRGAT